MLKQKHLFDERWKIYSYIRKVSMIQYHCQDFGTIHPHLFVLYDI